ncbi:Leucine Rich Repeat domain protein [Talaromyces stipitatus ATCC 10500]|uniref:Leucine Rich Repeat domain protein n=1 Tax=Talaromyces stipitatus (strain ATCC 10500 / CBS 375.48 / QM 6759 / NRRL 1006) TaxID=441959 RepID=B8LU27_TALSN|nr:Leucine Rich Repeat domain protein [Talaromyces stipitatus ATCC 10500]EED23857.1 Leucine Rich Repeat domain protein [Talaromyces stipitatus ATCC 10500]
MDAIPPSYEHAIMKDALAIIADYIPSADLCSASLVSRRWHAIFNPHLWGNPASHFGTENDAVYVALTRFRRTLPHARPEVRNLTHTIHLPPALSEIYGGPRASWLKDLLDYLPRLQSLIVSKLPFFDHNATISLKVPSDAQIYPPYNLRLLLAEGEPNTTSIGLATALSRFPLLIYLDLSYTSPAKDRIVLSVLSELPDLRVLKLRGIGLKDADAEFVANAIGTRVRLLDVRNNVLTDRSVRSLLQACFIPKGTSQITHNGDEYYLNHHPSLLQSPSLDNDFLDFLTRPLTGRSIFEHLPKAGITHLYISDNRLTVEGVAALLASKRLHLLDTGSVDTAQTLRADQPLLAPPGSRTDFNTVPGAEKLVPILGAYAKDGLTYLRVNHAIVTKDAPATSEAAITELLPELPADELDIHHFHAEMDTSHVIYEMPAGNELLCELEDTSISSSSVNRSTSVVKSNQYPDEPLLPRRGSVFAAEVVSTETTTDDKELLQYDHCHSDECSLSTERSRKIRDLLFKRPKTEVLPLKHGKSKTFPYLHPSHIPHVQTLILTDVPSHVSSSSPILSSLIRFITACSDEMLLAKLRARADYSFPPGRDRVKAEQQHAKSLFALECLVLEITPAVRNAAPPRALSPWKPQQHDRTGWQSTTGDFDSERLWSAATNDFSFFGNEECGVPEPHEEIATTILNERVRLVSDDDSIHSSVPELEGSNTSGPKQPTPRSSVPTMHNNSTSIVSNEPEVDLVSALASFRRSKKAEFERLKESNRHSPSTSSPCPSPFDSHGALPLHVEGYWPGEVKVIRNPTPKGRSGVVDIYGNYFEKGYLYP